MTAVVPSGWGLEIDGDMLCVTGTQGRIAGSSSPWLVSDGLLEDEVVPGAVQSLHQIQREIAEATTEPWPAASGSDFRAFPEPDGALAANELLLWFGDRSDPVLALDPIDLADVICTSDGDPRRRISIISTISASCPCTKISTDVDGLGH